MAPEMWWPIPVSKMDSIPLSSWFRFKSLTNGDLLWSKHWCNRWYIICANVNMLTSWGQLTEPKVNGFYVHLSLWIAPYKTNHIIHLLASLVHLLFCVSGALLDCFCCFLCCALNVWSSLTVGFPSENHLQGNRNFLIINQFQLTAILFTYI